MVSAVTWAVTGQAALGALVPWVAAFGFPFLQVEQLWWIVIAVAVLVGYALAFGIGIAIHDDSCPSSALGSIATWSGIVPAINAAVLLCVMSFGALREPVAALVPNWGEKAVFAAVASYYLFWSTAVGTTVAGYQATVC